MQQYSRRQVLTGISAGLAVAGAAATLPAGSASAAGKALFTNNLTPTSAETTAEPVVAYLHNPRSGDISLFVGSREITLHDPSIATRLALAASKEA